ncbi:MAG: hypothetical protein ACRERU_14840 [Methylococcales bacterium]
MQCFERQAMYLKLYSDAVTEIPQLQFDPILLDEVLSDFSIERFNTLIALGNRQRGKIITHIKAITGGEELHEDNPAVRRERGETKKSSVHISRLAGRTGKTLTISATIFP